MHQNDREFFVSSDAPVTFNDCADADANQLLGLVWTRLGATKSSRALGAPLVLRIRIIIDATTLHG